MFCPRRLEDAPVARPPATQCEISSGGTTSCVLRCARVTVARTQPHALAAPAPAMADTLLEVPDARATAEALRACDTLTLDALAHAHTLSIAFRNPAVSDAVVDAPFVYHMLELVRQARENAHAVAVRCLNNVLVAHERFRVLLVRTHTHAQGADECLSEALDAPAAYATRPVLVLALLRLGLRACTLSEDVRAALARSHAYTRRAAACVRDALLHAPPWRGAARGEPEGAGVEADVVVDGCKLLYALALTGSEALRETDTCECAAEVLAELLRVAEGASDALSCAAAAVEVGAAAPLQCARAHDLALQLMLAGPDAWLLRAKELPDASRLAVRACTNEIARFAGTVDVHEPANSTMVVAALHVARRLAVGDADCRASFCAAWGVHPLSSREGAAGADAVHEASAASAAFAAASAATAASSEASDDAARTRGMSPAASLHPALRACFQTLAEGVKTSAEELVYELCNRDLDCVVRNLGFGLAAGLLAAKGALALE